MNTKEIEEAVNQIRGDKSLNHWSLQQHSETLKALDLLLSLAQEYLAVKGFPNEREEHYFHGDCILGKEFNYSLHLCRLAVIKGVPSVEQMSRIIFEHYQNPNASAYLLATAIHKLYLERLGIKEEK